MEYNIETILEMYEDDYNPSSKVPGPRNMYDGGQLVSNTVDGSRPADHRPVCLGHGARGMARLN